MTLVNITVLMYGFVSFLQVLFTLSVFDCINLRCRKRKGLSLVIFARNSLRYSHRYYLLENRVHATTRYPPGMLPCLDGHSRCFPQESVCIFDENLNGKTALCPFGLHLKNCRDVKCKNTFKCPGSYCIPIRKVT